LSHHNQRKAIHTEPQRIEAGQSLRLSLLLATAIEILKYSVTDAKGNAVRHERLWPNQAANWNIPEDVKIGEVAVLPKGPIGPQADLVAVSWHDSSVEYVKGISRTDPGNNWQKILDGSPAYWGFRDALEFRPCRASAVLLSGVGRGSQDGRQRARKRVSRGCVSVHTLAH
jgi:hypothetical protein